MNKPTHFEQLGSLNDFAAREDADPKNPDVFRRYTKSLAEARRLHLESSIGHCVTAQVIEPLQHREAQTIHVQV